MRILKNQSGSTLLLVIISFAIISILGISILGVTALGYQSRQVDRKVKDAFYQAEKALDQVYSSIGNLVEQALNHAFEASENQLVDLMYRLFFAHMEYEVFIEAYEEQEIRLTQMQDQQLTNELQLIFKQSYLQYLVNTELLGHGITETNSQLSRMAKIAEYESLNIRSSYVTRSEDTGYIIKDVNLIYVDQLGIKGEIITDILIRTPDFPIEKDKLQITKLDHDLLNYSLISEQNIVINAGVSVNTQGNLYAKGAGVMVENPDNHAQAGIIVRANGKLSSKANKIITGSYLQVAGSGGRIQIMPEGDNPLFLADSIMVQTPATNGNIAILNGEQRYSMYIRDDLELNAANSHVSLAGRYYGFSMGEDRHNSSSSIIINGENSHLDLSNLSELVIGGNSYFTVGSGYMTGEAISVQGNPYPYIIPEDDTIQYQEMERLFQELGWGTIRRDERIASWDFIKIENKLQKAQLFYAYFLATNRLLDPLELAPLNDPTNFKIPKISLPYAWMQQMRQGIDPDGLITLGAVVFTDTDSSENRNLVYKSNVSVEQITNATANKDSLFYNYNKTLEPNKTVEGNNYSIIDRYTKLSDSRRDYIKVYDDYFVCVSNASIILKEDELLVDGNSYALNHLNRRGIILSNQDVTIQASTFEGLILAREDILLASDSEITGNSNLVKNILYSSIEGAEALKGYFYLNALNETKEVVYLPEQGSDESISLKYKELIGYDNWRKK